MTGTEFVLGSSIALFILVFFVWCVGCVLCGGGRGGFFTSAIVALVMMSIIGPVPTLVIGVIAVASFLKSIGE